MSGAAPPFPPYTLMVRKGTTASYTHWLAVCCDWWCVSGVKHVSFDIDKHTGFLCNRTVHF